MPVSSGPTSCCDLAHPRGRHRYDVHLEERIGAFNTFVLICSSVTIVLAFEAAKLNRAQQAKIFLALTLFLGALFLGVKAFEYNAKVRTRYLPS